MLIKHDVCQASSLQLSAAPLYQRILPDTRIRLGLLHRELPCGESLRTTKKVLYNLQDPALSFYYGSYLPHRERWRALGPNEKRAILHQHASRCWEHHCRREFPRSGRYWEGDVEIDLVAPFGEGRRLLVAECKWKSLKAGEEEARLGGLRARFAKTRLGRKNPDAVFRILSQKDL